ncbi:MAG: zinc-dependent metalloprotease [Saprospiraceae bacterium]
MNIKNLPSIIFFLCLPIFSIAQDQYCGALQPDFSGNNIDEATLHRMQELEAFTQQWIARNQHKVQTREIITIPVVVHILWTDDSENFTDLEVEAQIDGLTADFRMLNENAEIIPAVFQPLAADIEIEFCLATVDQDGKETNGIVRKETSVANIGSLKQDNRLRICYDELGGSNAWEPEDYINIWVGQLDALLGFATFPGMAESEYEDGVFIDPSAFGFFCSTNNGNFHGRTLTHEMGHFFNLFHIWGKDGCDTGDLVSDTPMQDTDHRYQCPSHPQISCGSPDMFMNYMDYTNDNCMAMFTNGQKMRMLAALDTFPRESLKNSGGCALGDTKDITLTPDDILLFPNPASDCLHIDLDIDNDLPIRMAIFDTAGREIFSNNFFVKDLRTFDISNISNGVYFIYFESNGQVASKKLIIDK